MLIFIKKRISMKQTYTLAALSTLVFSLFSTPSVFGQQKSCNSKCNTYTCVIDKIECLMKQSQKDYKTILDNLDSAEGYPDSKAEQIRNLRQRAFIAIEKQRLEVVSQKKIVRNKAKEIELAKLMSDSVSSLNGTLKYKFENAKAQFHKSDSIFKLIELQKIIVKEGIVEIEKILLNSDSIKPDTQLLLIQQKTKESEIALNILNNLMKEIKLPLNEVEIQFRSIQKSSSRKTRRIVSEVIERDRDTIQFQLKTLQLQMLLLSRNLKSLNREIKYK